MELWKFLSSHAFRVAASVVLVIFGLSACDQWEDLDTDLSISTDLVEINHPTNTGTFDVLNSGDDGTGMYFRISEDSDWLDVTPTSGETSDKAEITVTVDFTNFNATEEQECEITVRGADKTKTLTVRAQNDIPVCSVSATSLPFGDVEVGTSSSRQFTITNNGGGTLSGDVTPSSTGFTVSPTSYSLTSEQSRVFTVTFTPLNPIDYTFVIDCDNNCDDVTCTGTGVEEPIPPECQVSPTSLPFGDVEVGTPFSLQFTITNTGGGTLSGNVSESCSEFTVSPTSYSLTSDQDQVFTVTFTPPYTDYYSCTIDCGTPCDEYNVFCDGTGTEDPPICQVSPTSLDFGNVEVGQVGYRTFIITNVGGSTLEGNVQESCNYFNIEEGDEPYELGHDDSLEVTVSFSPEFGECEPQQCIISTGSSYCEDVTATGEGWAGMPQFAWYNGNIEICDCDSECQNAEGDCDGLAEPDEDICLKIGLTNIGDGPAYNVSGCLAIWSEDENCYNENNECGFWPDIPAGETVYNSSWEFDFNIPYDADCSDLDFYLTIWFYDACHDQEYSQTIHVWMPISY